MDPGYSGHASDVWLVRTASEEVVVRASRMEGDPSNDFWWGAWYLFGVDPRQVFDLEVTNRHLSELSPVPVPRVLRKAVIDGRQHVVVERLPGRALKSFVGQPDHMLEGLGEALARIHSRRFAWCGSPAGGEQYPASQFPLRLEATIRALVDRFYYGDVRIAAELKALCAAALAMPAPEAGALVMLDMDPTQFLTDGDRLTAVVDTEAYVIGPRELDFIGLEYVLDARGAAAVARGYSRIAPLPDLAAVRPVYRYLYRLLSVQGDVDLDRWLSWPALFA